MMKRLLSLVLALVMLCTMLPQVLVTVEAKEGFGPTIEGLSGQRDFRWPVPGYYGLSSCFYDNRIASGESKEHYAIDIATGGVKANIVASYDGIVCEITYNGSSDGGYGNAVMVKHNYVMATGETMTLYSRYAHMDSIKVSTGQKVIAGQTVVGTVGGSGYGGTPYPIHLDFQILTSTAWRQRETCSIDPYANNLLELPNGIYKGGTTDCCQRYIDLAKNLYSTPISYIGRCTSYPAYCAIEVSSSTTYIKSLPCSEKTDASSTNVEIASKGEQYQAIGLVENTAGNLVDFRIQRINCSGNKIHHLLCKLRINIFKINNNCPFLL